MEINREYNRIDEFAKHYFKGQKIYYIFVNEYTGSKELLELKIRTHLGNVLICSQEEDPSSVCIDVEDEGMIFSSFEEAEKKYKETTVECIFKAKEIENERAKPIRKRGRPKKVSA